MIPSPSLTWYVSLQPGLQRRGSVEGEVERERDFSYEEVKVLLQPTKWSKVLHSSVLRIRVDVAILNFLYGPGSNQEPEKQVWVHNGEGVIRH